MSFRNGPPVAVIQLRTSRPQTVKDRVLYSGIFIAFLLAQQNYAIVALDNLRTSICEVLGCAEVVLMMSANKEPLIVNYPKIIEKGSSSYPLEFFCRGCK